MVVDVTSDPFRVGTPRLLFETGPGFASGNYQTYYDVSPDGQRFLMERQVETDDMSEPELRLILHWTEELKQRVPIP
tara:strand:- start:69 stop:299 length:231 start_codon:yes stop_codon:yes gene_type:complete